MQKINKQASILLWAFFLSAIISVSFISISSKISKDLQKQSPIITKNSNKIYNDIEYLKSLETKKYTFSGSSNVTIEMLEGIILSYTGSESTGLTISTGATLNNINGDLSIKNLAGKTNFKISSDKNFTSAENSYNEVEQIGNKTLIKSRNIIKNP